MWKIIIQMTLSQNKLLEVFQSNTILAVGDKLSEQLDFTDSLCNYDTVGESKRRNRFGQSYRMDHVARAARINPACLFANEKDFD